MSESIAVNIEEYELPEDAKVTKVFEKLMRINAAVTQNGLRDVYSERHDQYEESYGIGF